MDPDPALDLDRDPDPVLSLNGIQIHGYWWIQPFPWSRIYILVWIDIWIQLLTSRGIQDFAISILIRTKLLNPGSWSNSIINAIGIRIKLLTGFGFGRSFYRDPKPDSSPALTGILIWKYDRKPERNFIRADLNDPDAQHCPIPDILHS